MKKIFVYAAVAALAMTAISCQKESLNESGNVSNDGLVFTASIDGAMDTKTTLTSEKKVNWEATDEITINGVVYTAAPKSDATKADFTKKNGGDSDPTGTYNAFYPTGIQADVTAGGTLPAEQTFAPGKITDLPMFATSTTTSLSFKNICAVLAVTVKNADFPSVKSIKISSSNCALSGAFTVSDGTTAVLTSDAKTAMGAVTLSCGTTAVTTASEGTVFYIAIPAQTYQNLKIELSKDGTSYTKAMTTKKDVDIAVAVNTVYPITFKADAASIFCFTALEAGAEVGMTIEEGGDLPHLVYSTDGGATWTSGDWDGAKITLANSGDKVYFKAGEQGNYGTFDIENEVPAMFTTSGNLKVSGNIMYLLNGSNPPTTMTDDNNTGCFYGLFAGTTITDASELELPAMSLSVACYCDMFNGCSSLSVAPTLPATSLASNCYASMFCDCTSLTAAPTLPAKTLQYESYCGMFDGCSNLSSVTMLATEVTGKNDDDKDCTWDDCIEEWLSGAGKNASSPTLTVAGSITDVKTSKTPGERIAAYAPLNWIIKNENDTTLLSPFIPGEFSVSATKKVKFIRGNLYRGHTSFQVESSQTAYPTSWKNNHVGHFFWTKTAAASYAETYSDGECTDSDHFFADGSDADHMLTVDGQSGLYVLSKDEWNYLLSTRGIGDSYFKYGVTVNGTENCLVIAPDDYSGTIVSSYDAKAWATAEASGLVCLPAAGYQDGSSLLGGGSYGFYWSATPYGGNKDFAYDLGFGDSSVSPSDRGYRNTGSSVRLVSTVSK